MKYRIEWPAPIGAKDEGSMRWVGNYEGKSPSEALRNARKENRDSQGDAKSMREYRKSMAVA